MQLFRRYPSIWCWDILILLSISQWYLRRFRSYRVDKHTHTHTPTNNKHQRKQYHLSLSLSLHGRQIHRVHVTTLWLKNAPTLADYNYDPVQSILIIFSRLFVNDHRSCLVVKFSTSPHICCHYTLWNTILYFSSITLLIAKKAPTSEFGWP